MEEEITSRGRNSRAIVSIICGLVSIVSLIVYPLVVPVFSLVGIVFGIVGLVEMSRTGEKGKVMAIAGIIISAVVWLLLIGFIIETIVKVIMWMLGKGTI
ncbi:DUF4190 domain-containing protein [Alkalihalophilus lindianensis]|uniref:DUF4190 domain-containing protein n=1 Tax=Alkalihalophilus lindianensis TaxID=1630542 RepID=A0ABU3XFR2_9BACI|nr:DUF4190 domain-containing protein [Alkalihalophilus lindianensis]MDV2686118.1 DUF4190 domain-containing protein [Alkalihalophilus lindianensis]